MQNKNKQIISLSGGKDSTAMLLMMIEKGEKVDEIIWFDTGWEWPQMYEHIKKLEKYIKRPIWELHSKAPFDYWMFQKPIYKNRKKDALEYYGYGWPSMQRRWCTTLKTDVITYFQRMYVDPICCVGIAADEIKRVKTKEQQEKNPKINGVLRYPLVEYNITEKQALQYCYDKGFDWGGLYEEFGRVSCFCCPLQKLQDLRIVKKKYSEIWNQMLWMDSHCREAHHKYKFRQGKSIHDINDMFDREAKMKFFK